MLARVYGSEYKAAYIPGLSKALKELGICLPYAASAFLEKLDYWQSLGCGYRTSDGIRWIHNNYSEWANQLGLSKQQVGRVVRSLCSIGILLKENYASLCKRLRDKPSGAWHSHNTTSWISINFDVLRELCGFISKESKPALGTEVQNQISQNLEVNNAKSKTELSTIYTKTHNSTQKPEKEKNKSVDNTIPDPWEQSETNSVAVDCQDDVKEINEINPQIVSVDPKPPRCSEIPKNRKIEQREPYVWEYEINKPHKLFIKWLANTHFKPQGGHWASGANIYAFSYINNHPEAVEEVLYPEFLTWMARLRDNANQQQAADIIAILPSWFAEDPDASEDNNRQIINDFDLLIKRGAELAIPGNTAPGSRQSVPFLQGEEAKTIQPMSELKPRLTQAQEQAVTDEQLAMVNERWKKWKANEDKKAATIVKTFVHLHSQFVKITDAGVVRTE